ncbi:hypothetical protein RhiirB3_491532 [Rhizophagus irregularis]|nr:hypothetical protein RhiirB3_491532 [Rhizophagus irregularis]
MDFLTIFVCFKNAMLKLKDTCYSCQKCLHCFELPQQEPCKCNKNKQPTRTKHLKRAQQIYQCTFKPDPLFLKANKYLFDANEKFGYNSNFEESFSYTFCSTCNSKIQRYRNADRKDQQTLKENNKVAPSDLSNEKEVVNVVKEKNHKIFSLVSSDTEEGEGIDDIEINDEDSDLEEVKVQIIVKSNIIKVPMAKTLNIEPVSYKKSSDESGFSSEELQYTKKKKSRAICEEDLSKEERTRSEINEAATYEVLPSYPTFDAKSSVSVNKNNLTAQTQMSCDITNELRQ